MVTNKLLNVAKAMAEYEGWTFNNKNPGDPKAGSRAWRQHNPGNLRKSPFAIATLDNYAVFIDDTTGFYALVWDLWMKANGRTSTKLTGESSLYELIKIYSGENDEITTRYARAVEQKTGLKMTLQLKELVK